MDTFWTDQAPKKCDYCEFEIGWTFIDGKTIDGPWAIMCPYCYFRKGAGLGEGLGQLYGREVDGQWRKLKG